MSVCAASEQHQRGFFSFRGTGPLTDSDKAVIRQMERMLELMGEPLDSILLRALLAVEQGDRQEAAACLKAMASAIADAPPNMLAELIPPLRAMQLLESLTY